MTQELSQVNVSPKHVFEDGIMALITPLERIFSLLDESQWWSRDRMIEAQRLELSRLIQHAKSTTHFYRTRLNCLFRANGTIDWDRWTDIPIMTRANLSLERDSIQSQRPVHAHGPLTLMRTSGSTGDPVEFLAPRMMNNWAVASYWRGQKWANMDWSETIIHMGPESPKWTVGDVMGPWGPFWLKDAARGRRIFATYTTNPADRVNLIKKYNSVYASFTTGLANSFIEYLRSTSIDVGLRTARFVGGTANEYIRKDFQDLLGADVVELYSSKEGGAMAHPCPLGHGWHQNAESALVEIVDDLGKPVLSGETGRVVITPFGNTATPLIRYDQGDLAIAGPLEICPCGRTLPRIVSFSGRLKHSFLKPNGERVGELSMEARRQLGAGIWQVARVAEHSFEVRYKKRDWGVAPNLRDFRQSFFKAYYSEAVLTVIEVDDFVLGSTGKHMDRVDEWKPESQSSI